MNKQQLFDKVATHLLTQMKQSKDGQSCVYRSPNGNKCAVGCLITDEYYSRRLEGFNVNDDAVKDAVIGSVGRLSEASFNMLYHLQAVHDEYAPEEWRAQLKILAKDWKVNQRVVQ